MDCKLTISHQESLQKDVQQHAGLHQEEQEEDHDPPPLLSPGEKHTECKSSAGLLDTGYRVSGESPVKGKRHD